MMVMAMLNVLKAVLLNRVTHKSMELTMMRFFHQLHGISQYVSCLLMLQSTN